MGREDDMTEPVGEGPEPSEPDEYNTCGEGDDWYPEHDYDEIQCRRCGADPEDWSVTL